MAYKKWTATCPRCSKENVSADQVCSNCGHGPVWVEFWTFARETHKTFQCQRCKEKYSDVPCRGCGAHLGGVTKQSEDFSVLQFIGAIVGLVLIGIVVWVCVLLWGAITSAHQQEQRDNPYHLPRDPYPRSAGAPVTPANAEPQFANSFVEYRSDADDLAKLLPPITPSQIRTDDCGGVLRGG